MPRVESGGIDLADECDAPDPQKAYEQSRRQCPAQRMAAGCADESVQLFIRDMDHIDVESPQRSRRVPQLQALAGRRCDLVDVTQDRCRRAMCHPHRDAARARAKETEEHTPILGFECGGPTMTDVFVSLSGQDDNLGDSALRAGLLRGLRLPDATVHVVLDGQSSDYVAGLALHATDRVYRDRGAWFGLAARSARPVYVLNAGEINPQPRRRFPRPEHVSEMRTVLGRGGIIIAAGLGLRDPAVSSHAVFDDVLRRAHVLAWRDHGSRDAVGIGDVAPDWAFALGSATSDWPAASSRPWITVTLRFDRPWPDDAWLREVRAFARRADCSLVTVAQVARDAPRAVALADALDGDYLVAPSTSHDALDRHVRDTFARSFAVISDRAHALIIGATEGAWPVGSAAQPQKIARILDAAQIGRLTGDHDGLASRLDGLGASTVDLAGAIDAARSSIGGLGGRIREIISDMA